MVSTVTKVHARQIFDSRGNPTIEVEVLTGDGKKRKKHKRIIFFCASIEETP